MPISVPHLRPRRGWIAQLVSLATTVVATNTRKIIEWLKDQIGVTSIFSAPVERPGRRDLSPGWTTAPSAPPGISEAA